METLGKGGWQANSAACNNLPLGEGLLKNHLLLVPWYSMGSSGWILGAGPCAPVGASYQTLHLCWLVRPGSGGLRDQQWKDSSLLGDDILWGGIFSGGLFHSGSFKSGGLAVEASRWFGPGFSCKTSSSNGGGFGSIFCNGADLGMTTRHVKVSTLGREVWRIRGERGLVWVVFWKLGAGPIWGLKGCPFSLANPSILFVHTFFSLFHFPFLPSGFASWGLTFQCYWIRVARGSFRACGWRATGFSLNQTLYS